MTDETVTLPSTYKDEDLVYVDPEARIVVGVVEWEKNGNPKALLMKEKEKEEAEDKGKGDRRRKEFKRYYPWGTYKSMKNIYRLEGKQKKPLPEATLDQVIEKALSQPFWD